MASANLSPQPAASLKRKLNDPTTSFRRAPSQKAVKHNELDSPRGGTNGNPPHSSKAAFVQDDSEEDHADIAAGPELPPVEDVDDGPGDDEDGRFFGGGVSKEERDVLDYIDQNEDGDVEEQIDLTWLKRTALNFERKITRNAELRAKYEDEPMKFVSSEADLDSEIKGLSLLSEHPELYKDFVRSGCSDSLVGLLAHDNTDIAIASTEIISDLIDEDSAIPAQDWSLLVKSMLKADLIGLLVSNLGRLDETLDTDNAGVYHILNVLENLMSDSGNAEKLGEQTKLLKWLLHRIARADDVAPSKVGQNRQYAAEILVMLAQNHGENAGRLVELGAMDEILQLLNAWRRRDPEKDSDEEEFAGNLFDCLVTLVMHSQGRARFIEDEGVELLLIMLKEGKFSKDAALRALDHAAGGFDGGAICERLVHAGGLKQIFTILMKSNKLRREATENLIGLLSSLLRLLPAGSSARLRLLAKFVEKDYEKCRRLVELRKHYGQRVSIAETQIDQDKTALTQDEVELVEDDFLSRKMDAGLFPLQTLDVILAWLIAEDEGTRSYLTEALAGDEGNGLVSIRDSLRNQRDGVELEGSPDAAATRDMLQALLGSLE